MTPAPADRSEADAQVWGGRRGTAVSAVVFVVLVLALTLVVVLGWGHQGAGSDPAAGRGSAPSAAAGGTATPPAADTRASGGGAPLTAAPGGVVWRLVDGVALPFSAADGPRTVSGGVASGFARTPAGALLACVQTTFRIGNIDPQAQASVVRAMVIGAGQPGLLASRPAAALTVRPQMAGFRYVSYAGGQAVIRLAWRVTDVASGTAQFLDVGELNLAWADGDWRLVDDGSQPPPPTALDADLTGYVVFGGA